MFEKLNKQSAIAIAIVVILGIFAIVGTVIFLKDKGSTEATEIASENGLNGETVEQQNEENNQQNSTDVTSENNEQTQSSEANNSQANGRANNNQVNSTTNNNQRQNNNSVTNNSESLTTGTTVTGGENRVAENGTAQGSTDSNSTGVDSIQGTTITRVTEGDLVKVTDDRNVAWSPMDFEVQSASAKIDGEKSKVTIEKKAETKTGSNIVSQGEEIEYTLIATNNSAEDLKGIEVADNIPEKTTYVENSATENANIVTENDRVIGLKWYVDISAGESAQLKFKVKVNEDATGTISNVALTNGNTPSDIVRTAIITAEKNGTISRDGVILEKQPAKLNDIITYTINVENTGDIEGTTIVKDQKLGEILNSKIGEMYGDVIITDNNGQKEYSPEELINGIEVNIKEKSKVTVTFSIKVVKIDGKIINFATTGDNEEPTNEDEKDTYGFDIEKKLTKIERNGKSINTELPAQQGDILTYTISIHNAGSVDLNNLDVTDKLPEELSKQSATEFTNVSVKAGETITLEVKAKVEIVNGTIVNKVLVEDKDENEEPKEDTETTETIGFTIKKEATLIKADINKENKEYLDKAEVGDTIHYIITVENTGSVILKNLVIEDIKIDVRETIDLEDIYIYVIEKDYIVTERDFVKLADGTVADIHNQATASYTDTENPDNNITKEDEKDVPAREKYAYKVNYLEKGTNKVLHDQKVQNGMTFESTVTSADEVIDIDGYNYDSVDKDTLTITTGDNVINIYYTKRTDLSYKVNYLEKDTNKVLHDQKVQNGMTFGDTVTSANEVIEINGYNYESVDKETLTITTRDNVINIYYVKIDVELTKTALLSNGKEALPLYQFKEGEIVKFKLTVKNNSNTNIVKNYVVTDTLPSELSIYGEQPNGISVDKNVITWNIDKIQPNETQSVIITTKVNQDKWSGNKYLHDISQVTMGTGTTMTRKTYNKNYNNAYKYDNDDKYYNCGFYVYNSKNGEIPYENGETQWDTSNYSSVGFGRVNGIQFDDTLSSIDDLNQVIDAHNNVNKYIKYAPNYQLGDGKVILWYVAKKVSPSDETINGTTTYVKYHVDGIIVDLKDIYSVKNEIVGSSGEKASDIILIKDDGSSQMKASDSIIPKNKMMNTFDNVNEVLIKQDEEEINIEEENKNYISVNESEEEVMEEKNIESEVSNNAQESQTTNSVINDLEIKEEEKNDIDDNKEENSTENATDEEMECNDENITIVQKQILTAE